MKSGIPQVVFIILYNGDKSLHDSKEIHQFFLLSISDKVHT